MNKTIREQIAANAVDKSGIREEIAAAEAAQDKLARETLLVAMGGVEVEKKLKRADRRYRKLAKEHPAFVAEGGCLKQNSFVHFEIGGMAFSHGFGDYVNAPYRLRIADEGLKQRWIDADQAVDAAREKACDLRAEVRATLNQFRTIKQALKVWPELAEILPPEEAAEVKLPAVKTSELNKAIGLGGDA